MKFHWGHGIFLFYVVFVLTLIGVVIASTKVDRGLVMDDYYSLDLEYQNFYNENSNGKYDSTLSINYDIEGQVVTISSTEKLAGEVVFYRPSNSKLDFKRSIKDHETAIKTDKLATGIWMIQVSYTKQNKNFYKETKIYI